MARIQKNKVNIVVLGDIGRSPRMQYHALSFAEEGFTVEMIGFSGSEPIDKLSAQPNVKFRYMKNCPDLKQYLPTLLAYIFKVLWQSVALFFTLILSQSCDYLLIQNPPAIPTLTVCHFYSLIFRCKFIIDWHNYAHSLMALSLRPEHKLVKISKYIEYYFGKKSHYNICVTKAMKEDLHTNYGIECKVLYDRPSEIFHQVSAEEKHGLFLRLCEEYPVFGENYENGETIFTKVADNTVVLKNNRPGMIVSSTSWTEDEDFSILLSALDEYEISCEIASDLPNLICVITGKGPLKEFYVNLISRRKWKHTAVATPWLAPADYPILLGCADLGVSLHNSSSGFDLPMKVVDMFGCRVPVCAHNFSCISELVKHEVNSLVFNNEEELSRQIQSWFKHFPNVKNVKHENFKNEIDKFRKVQWHSNWKLNVLPMIEM